MKKTLAIILALILVLGLAACSGTNGNSENASENTNTAQNTAANTNAAENTSENTNSSENASGGKVTGDNTGENTDPTFEFNYSEYFEENGYWKGITASEYVEIPDLDKIEIKRSDIDDDIEYLRSSFAVEKKSDEDREITETDYVNIDYVGSIDGVEFEGGSTEGEGTTVNITTTNYIDGFLPQLVGHKPGETFDINVTFPESYGNAELAGKDAVFRITINYLVDMEMPEWNDAFVEENLSEEYEWYTVAEAEADIKAYYVNAYLIDNSTFKQDIPQVMLDFHRESALAYYREYAEMYGMSFEDFMQTYLQISDEDLIWESIREDAEDYSRNYLVYQAIAEKLGYTVSDDEIKEYFLDFGMDDYSSVVEEYGLPYIRFSVMSDTIIEKIAPDAAIVD